MSVLIGMLQDLDERGQAPQVSPAVAAAIESSIQPAGTREDRHAGRLRGGLLLCGVLVLAASGTYFWWSRGAHGPVIDASRGTTAPAVAVVLPAPPPHVDAPAATNTTAPAKAAPAPGPAKEPHSGPGAAPAATKPVRPTPATAVAAALDDVAHTAAAGAIANATGGTVPAGDNNGVVLRSHDSADTELARAYEMANRGRNAEAIAVLQRSLVNAPSHAETRLALATLLGEAGQHEAELTVLVDGASLDPVHFAVLAARLQAEQGSPAAALDTLDRLPAGQRDGEYHAVVAAIAQRVDRHDIAVREFRLAIASGAPRAVWWVGLGVSLEQIDHKTEALDAYRQARAQGGASSATADFAAQRLAALRGFDTAGSGPAPVASGR